MKKVYKKIFENTTFQTIGLIKPNYFGLCHKCDMAWLLHRPKSLSKYDFEWVCPHCGRELDIEKLRRNKILFDMQKQIIKYREQEQNTLGIFK